MRKFLKPVGVVLGVVAALVLTAFSITEEVPLADVSGKVVFSDNGLPASKAEVHVDAPGFNFFASVKAAEDGTFVFHNVPRALVNLSGIAPGYSANQYELIRKESRKVLLRLNWQGDQLNLSANQPVFTPDERPEIVMNGITRRDTVSIRLFKFDDKEIFDKRTSYSLARNIAYGRYPGMDEQIEPYAFYAEEYKLTSRDIQGHFAESMRLPKLEEGLYILRAQVEGVKVHRWINVSRLGLVAKVSPKGLMGYVTDIVSGKPVPGVEVELHGPDNVRSLGRTNADGIVAYSGRPSHSDSYVMSASQGQSKAFAMFYWYPDSDGHAAAVHFETDRPIYRPGDTVRFRGFVRVPTQQGYRLPNYKSVQVTISDPDETVIKSETVRMTSLGGFDGTFETLPELTGGYHIQAKIDEQAFDEYVPVAAYRKSEFKITVTPERPYYLIGEQAKFVVKAEYYTGEPVVGVKIDAWAARAKRWKWSPFDEEDEDYWYGGGDYTYGSEYVHDYQATTDENGVAVFTVPTAAPKTLDDWETETDFVYTLNVTASDASGRYFEGDGKVDVARGDVDLEIASDDYIVAPGTAAVFKLRAKDYGTGKPTGGRTVTVKFGQEVWQKGKSTLRVSRSVNVRLDENGEATASFTPETSGDYYVEASLKDNGGRTVKTSDYIWSYAYGGSFGGPAPKMQLVLDKKQYAVGDTANAVVRTDRPGGTALVTVEADGVLWSKVVPLEGEATEIGIPVDKAFRPNANVEVAYVRNKSFSSASRMLAVDMADDVLDVKVEPSTKELLPGGSVKYTVTTRDSSGAPVSADVAFTVVDEAVYAIREDTSDPAQSFFPRRWSSVMTVYSFSDVYLDGDDKSEVDMQVRRDFRDTAFWQPYVETDDNGKASIEVKLPDNLTSWRATATAVTADARSGKGRTNVVARKPIMVRLSTPAFMVEDERQTVGATVMNETDQRRTIRVRADLTGLEVTGSTSSTLTIDPRSSAKVTWDVTAKAPGEARMLVAAISDGAGMNDALEKTFEVKTNGPTYTSYSAGDTDGQATFEIEVDPNAHSGSVEVSVTPTLLGSIVGSIDGLVRYPYGCVEQTMDRFMPAMVVSRYLHATGISRPDLDEKIADVAKKSQARLRSMQHSDGGFGWWSYDKSDPEMTALVLEGLYQAERAGADVNVEMRDRAIQWSKNFMLNVRPKYLWRDDSLRLAYALSLQGVDPSVWFVALPQKPEEEKDVAMLARTVLAIDVTKGHLPPESKKIHDAAYNRLISLAAVGDATASWEAEWWNEPTAIALQALIKEDPHSDLVTKTLRFLANRRRGRGWWSTRDTAQTVLAGIEYLEAVYQPGANVGVTITGPDGVDHLFQFDSRDPSAEKTLTIPVSSLKKGKNAFKVKVEGQGRVYYSTKLEQSIYDKSPKPEPYGKDLSIKREYFRMESQRLEDGTIRLMPSKEPVTSAKSGEVLHCRLTVTSSMDREFVLIHDPALSNSRFVDRGDVDIYEWRYWWSDQSYFDDHTAVFMRYLQAGDSVIEYTVRAEASGNSFALPATVSLMYQPDIRATTGTTTLEVHQ